MDRHPPHPSSFRIVLLAALVLGAAGCDSPQTPLAPTPRPPQAPVPQAPPLTTLRGSVTDTAFRALADVSLEVVEGPQVGMSTRSDTTGSFAFVGTFDDTTRVRASKDGHVSATVTISPVCATCSPTPRWVYFYLAVLAPPVSIAGAYTLTLGVDGACAGLPDEMRTRVYAATIAPVSDPHSPPNTLFTATVSDAPFLDNYKSFSIGVAGDFVTFAFGGHGPYLVEQVAPQIYLAWDGWGQASLGTAPISTIATPFEGVVDYCELKGDMGRYFECSPAQTVAQAHCVSKTHRLTLTRR